VRTIFRLICVFLLFGVTAVIAADEEPLDSVPIPEDTVQVVPEPEDSVVVPEILKDTTMYLPGTALLGYLDVTDSVDLEQHLPQKPMTALLKSMVVPGWGQLGNKRYFKAALYAGLDALFIVRAVNYRKEARDFYDLYQAADSIDERNVYYADYDNRRTRRNKATWFAVIVTFLATFDAYVDAHLAGFPTEADEKALSFEVEPDMEGGISARLTWQF